MSSDGRDIKDFRNEKDRPMKRPIAFRGAVFPAAALGALALVCRAAAERAPGIAAAPGGAGAVHPGLSGSGYLAVLRGAELPS